MGKTIRIWNGCVVIAVISVDETGYSVQEVGGAGSSLTTDIELDPFAGLIVDHSARRSPVDFREPEE